MKPLLLTFDVEEFDLPLELGRGLERESQLRVTARGVRRLLPLLESRATPATFFVTGAFARARPELVAAIAAAGHEIGVHGLEHGDDYARLPADEAVARLQEARALIESAVQHAVSGVRTPRLRSCPAAVLRRAGFTYDASAHPTWIPGRYNGLALRRRPWRDDGLLILPISVLPAVRLPVSWLWYRSLGPLLSRPVLRAAALGAPYLHLYFHPWEAVPLRPLGVPALLALRTGAPFLAMLDDLLARAPRWLTPMTASQFVATLA